ncbi:MAG: DUF2948 family protein [Xanthobacteraceae bacterium]
MDSLKLIAFDSDDLKTISAHLQDAIACVADIVWLPREQRLVIALNRFDWVSAEAAKPQYRRRYAALRFERVNSFKSRNIDPASRATMLNLLAVEFNETDAPAGEVTLTFSGGAAVRLQVECLEAELADLGPAWTTVHRPGHPEEATG